MVQDDVQWYHIPFIKWNTIIIAFVDGHRSGASASMGELEALAVRCHKGTSRLLNSHKEKTP